MQISCPNCKTDFTINQNEIGSQGRKVRCSCCKYTWLFQPQPPSTLPAAIPVFSTEIAKYYLQMPRRDKTINSRYYLYILLWAILISAILVKSWVMLTNYFNDSTGIKVEQVAVEYLPLKNQIVVFYALHNYHEKSYLLPIVKIRLLDQQGLPLKTHFIDDPIEIPPDYTLKLSTTFVIGDYKANKIDISLGDQLEVLVPAL